MPLVFGESRFLELYPSIDRVLKTPVMSVPVNEAHYINALWKLQRLANECITTKKQNKGTFVKASVYYTCPDTQWLAAEIAANVLMACGLDLVIDLYEHSSFIVANNVRSDNLAAWHKLVTRAEKPRLPFGECEIRANCAAAILPRHPTHHERATTLSKSSEPYSLLRKALANPKTEEEDKEVIRALDERIRDFASKVLPASDDAGYRKAPKVLPPGGFRDVKDGKLYYTVQPGDYGGKILSKWGRKMCVKELDDFMDINDFDVRKPTDITVGTTLKIPEHWGAPDIPSFDLPRVHGLCEHGYGKEPACPTCDKR